ncbi:MAG: RNA-binding protein [Planctomycetes bacterium]|nr:RNA-binding protein [Planctomycetota bacterium]
MSANKVYVGNLPFNFSKVDLQELFQGFGTVVSAEVIMDRETGRSRGFGFVEMDSAEALQKAVAGLHERNVQGRNLTVTEARERAPRALGAGPRPGGAGGGGFRPSGPPRSFSGGGAGAPRGGGAGGGGGWSGGDRGEGRPRFDRGGGKDRRDRDEDRGGGRSRRGKDWGGDDDGR